MTEHKISHLDRLKWNESLFESVKNIFEVAQENCELTDHRYPITGDEKVAWIGSICMPKAFVLFYEARPRVMWVDIIFVQSDHRRIGYGSLLMGHVREFAERAGYTRIEYGTDFGNKASRGMGEKLGYVDWSVGYALPLPDTVALAEREIDRTESETGLPF